jgi:DNA sulfur modification protein DndC
MDLANLPDKLREIKRNIRQEYLSENESPWIIGYSGGKDSTLVLHLVVECLLSLPEDLRKRKVFVISNDTLVESPVYMSHVYQSIKQLKEGVKALNLPIEIAVSKPEIDNTFWVNLIGRGYPAPNRVFRWCTDRMKIKPTTKFITDCVSKDGQAILLLGVRSAESSDRAKRVQKYTDESQVDSNGKVNPYGLSPHNDINGCLIFRPIVTLTNEEVWILIFNSRPSWGGTFDALISLYRNATSDECPFVVDQNEAASCGTQNARFGCWTCTVVDKDKSIDALIDSGFEYLEGLSQFRDFLKNISNNPDMRSMIRRNGQPGLGPLTFEARELILEKLLALQKEVDMQLISESEQLRIKLIWAKDKTDKIIRDDVASRIEYGI